MAAKDTNDKKPGRAARGNKTEFVLSFPRDLPARELVEKAREKGVELSEAYVYKIRSTSGAPREKKPKAGRSGGGSKAEFVRALPDGISFADAEQRAKAAGIALTKAYFYVLRSEAKKERGGAPKRERTAPAAPASRARAASLRLTSDDPHEAALLEAVRVLGVARARALLDAVQKLEQGR